MIPFTKAHGNGNDFVIFDAELTGDRVREAGFIQEVCNRHRGIGGDGVLVISATWADEVAFKLDYYNADGTWETFCCNGSRCAVQYWGRRENYSGNLRIETGAGIHEAAIMPDGEVKIQIISPKFKEETITVKGRRGRHVDSGAPHFVIELDKIDRDLVAREGPAIRYDEHFQPRGINVNFLEQTGPSTIKVITYEKGVESVMQSCASGSAAACYFAANTYNIPSPIQIENPGGSLIAEFDKAWEQFNIIGPAILLYDSHLPDDFPT